jgi:hypothetical protein
VLRQENPPAKLTWPKPNQLVLTDRVLLDLITNKLNIKIVIDEDEWWLGLQNGAEPCLSPAVLAETEVATTAFHHRRNVTNGGSQCYCLNGFPEMHDFGEMSMHYGLPTRQMHASRLK